MAAIVFNVELNVQGRDLIEQAQVGGGFGLGVDAGIHKAPFEKIIPKSAGFDKR
jgi:hypothetical protein